MQCEILVVGYVGSFAMVQSGLLIWRLLMEAFTEVHFSQRPQVPLNSQNLNGGELKIGLWCVPHPTSVQNTTWEHGLKVLVQRK